MSVAAAATERETPEVNRVCTLFLETVLEHHLLTFNRKTQAEWIKRASHFSRRWLAEMEILGKVYHYGGTVNPTLRKRVADAVTHLGDIHLVELALATDQRIVSRDKRARNRFKTAAKVVEILAPLLWIDPEKEGDSAVKWLKQGAPTEESRMLGHAATQRTRQRNT